MADVALDFGGNIGVLKDTISKTVSKEVIEALRKEKIPFKAVDGGSKSGPSVSPSPQQTSKPQAQPQNENVQKYSQMLNEKYKQKKDIVDKTRDGYRTGENQIAGVSSDLNELRSGGYDQIIARKMESLAKFKDTVKSLFGRKGEKDGGGGLFPQKDGQDPTKPNGKGNNLPAIPGRDRPFKEIKVEKAIIERADFKHSPSGLGGGGKPGSGGGGGGLSGMALMGGLGPVGMAAGMASLGVGAVIGGISQIGQMYSDVLASQEKTMGAVGYVGDGGGLLRNSEMAQVKLTRMRHSESGMDGSYQYGLRNRKYVDETYYDGSNPNFKSESIDKNLRGEFDRNRGAITDLYKRKGSKDNMDMIERLQQRQRDIGVLSNAQEQSITTKKKVDTYGDSNLDVKFGERMGIGGVAGAELFGKARLYGGDYSAGAGDETGSRLTDAKFKEIIASGMLAGFKGTRMAEYLKGLVSIQEQSYREGYGEQSAGDIMKMTDLFSSRGIRGERSLDITKGLIGASQKKGDTLNSMLLGMFMEDGDTHLAAAAKAEKGIADRDNLDRIRTDMFGGDDEAFAEFLYSTDRMKANELQRFQKSDGTYDFSRKNVQAVDRRAVNEEFNRISTYGGQQHISQANKVDNMILKFKEVYDVHVEALKAMTNMANELIPILSKMLGTLGLKGIQIVGKVTN